MPIGTTSPRPESCRYLYTFGPDDLGQDDRLRAEIGSIFVWSPAPAPLTLSTRRQLETVQVLLDEAPLYGHHRYTLLLEIPPTIVNPPPQT